MLPASWIINVNINVNIFNTEKLACPTDVMRTLIGLLCVTLETHVGT